MVQAAEKKSLIDETVVKLSQELDIYLVKYQKSKLSKKKYLYKGMWSGAIAMKKECLWQMKF
ncbi:aspartyl-phosphate phosphatase Spo0E family protein [Paenibacillus alvei]|uniref:aspartyl-phosphate phosphatase Spo0E family protein n=1 Tax=Paenibacillus alvei TaxID=44250 RepID=UPI0013DB750E|nr:aspartyl-phosphate phosphatase Spo0E family protein [Paenibacillus alvei]NEZ45443.1 Spo0E family sporulation regulatory protein-aspartic acid phosphatase [Paenibacillus alvei]